MIGPFIIFLFVVILVTCFHRFAVISNGSITIISPLVLIREFQIEVHFEGGISLCLQLAVSLCHFVIQTLKGK